MIGKKSATVVTAAVAMLVALLLALRSPDQDSRFNPSTSPAYLPSGQENFSHYVEENRRRIRQALENYYFSGQDNPFGSQYSIDEVVSMRAPFEILPDQSRCNDAVSSPLQGFLLVHGLTDSPYLLSELAASLADRFPCARIRSLLMPGHGTVPGDLLKVSLADWQQAIRYGVESFEGMVDELFLVGYSNGAALAIDQLHLHPRQSLIKGLILLSPGLEAAQRSIALAPYLQYFLRWVSKGPDRDAAKYDSMPTSAAAVFYRLTEKIKQPGLPRLEIPVFMAISGDDTTVNNAYAADYFCQQAAPPSSRLIWYRSVATGVTPDANCPGLQVIDVADVPERYISHSHVAIAMPADNEHYGMDGHYSVCTAYGEYPQLHDQCKNDKFNTVYGENTLRDETLLYRGKVVRRATFNPLYEELVAAITCFVDAHCQFQQ